MSRKINPSFVVLLLLLTSCGWDTDETYIPTWQASWLITQDSLGGRHLLRIDSSTVIEYADVPRAMDLADGEWWTLDAAATLSQRDLKTGEVISSWTIPGQDHQDVARGLERIYVTGADSSLYFFHPKKESWVAVDLPGKGGLVSTRADRAFVQVEDSVVLRVQEQTYSFTDTIYFTTTIKGFQKDGSHITYVFSTDGVSLFRTRMLYSNATMNPFQQRVSLEEILISPYRRQEFGQEYTDNLEVADGCLTRVNTICGQQFWPIWETGDILIFDHDSLFRYDLRSGEKLFSYGKSSGSITDGVNVVTK
ncbi:MAG: hypothetical protein NWR72_06485 [Bacteroidia bacterium]|nr:hypothetical protein [Bacteroidia bacterium]